MLTSTVSVLIPVLFVVLLGYAAGRAKAFDAEQVVGINELVLDFALPASLFVGIVGISRTQLASSFSFFLVILVVLLGSYAIAFMIGRLVLKLSAATAALFALGAAFPAAPFFGPAVLGGLFGSSSALSISSIAIIANLVLVPVSLVILESTRVAQPRPVAPPVRELAAVGARSADTLQERSTDAAAVTPRAVIGQAVASALKQPFVWAPVLALVLVLTGVGVPAIVDAMLNLIGQTTSGIALFVAGLLLAAHSFRLNLAVTVDTALKSLGQPAVMLGLVLLVGLPNPVASQGVAAMALSSAVIATMLASRYKLYQSEAASTMLASSALMLVTLPVFMSLAGS